MNRTPRCYAKNRAGHTCHCPILYPNGRCRMHGGPRSRDGAKPRREGRPHHKKSTRLHERSDQPWIWVGAYLLDRSGEVICGDDIRMFNAGVSATSDTLRSQPRYRTGDPHICPKTRLEIVPGGGCTNRYFWVCVCKKRCAVLYRKLGASDEWLCMLCCGFRYACLSRLGSGDRKRPTRALLQKRRLHSIICNGRPRGIRRLTYERLCKRLVSKHRTIDELAAPRIARSHRTRGRW